MSDIADKKEKIRQLAHQIWLEEGKPEGRATEHWRRAEDIVERSEQAPAKLLAPAAEIKSSLSAPASAQRKAPPGRKKTAGAARSSTPRKDRSSAPQIDE